MKLGTIKEYYNNYSSVIPFFSSPNDILVNNIDRIPLNKLMALGDNKNNDSTENVTPLATEIESDDPEITFSEDTSISDNKQILQKEEIAETKEELEISNPEPQDEVVEEMPEQTKTKLVLTDKGNNESAKSVSPIVTPQKGKYYIIAGSFQDEKNAEKMVRRLVQKGFLSSIIGKNKYGNHRVCFSSFTSSQEANKQLAVIRKEENPSAWVLEF